MNYDELNNAFDTKNAKFSVHTEYINWNADWDSNKFANKKLLTAIARKGKITLRHTGWGDEIFEKEFTNPTWMDVMKFFDEAIEKVDDHHHIFLEDIFEDGTICAGS